MVKLLLIVVGVGCYLIVVVNLVFVDDLVDGVDLFVSVIVFFLISYCFDCYGYDQLEVGLILQWHSVLVINIDDVDVWYKVFGMVECGFMFFLDEMQFILEEVLVFVERICLEFDKFDCIDRVYLGCVIIW